jgi:aspartate aminotransferase
MSYFENIKEIPTEEGLFSNEFEKDTRKDKLNCSIGMIYDEEGNKKEISFIKEVETELFNKNLNKEYSTLLGLQEFNQSVFKLFFPNEELVEGGNFFCIQSSTGGSALRIGSDLLRKNLSNDIYVSDPTFSMYKYLFSQANIKHYPYYDKENKCLDFDGFITFLNHLPEQQVINIQVSNHNPTGLDLSEKQWEILAKTFLTKKHFAFFDCAYLGYSTGKFDKDLFGVHTFLKNKIEFFLAYSSAKTTLNYSDDIGALMGWLNDSEIVKNVLSNLAVINRSYYSFASLQGARIVNHFLTLKKSELEKEINSIVLNLNDKREYFVKLLLENNVNRKVVELVKSQKGIYLFLDLNDLQVAKLKKDHGIYLCENGRANLSSLNKNNIERFVEAYLSIIKN